jgi:hypothetical protein
MTVQVADPAEPSAAGEQESEDTNATADKPTLAVVEALL